MARIDIKILKKIDKSRNSIHGKVPASYTIFYAEGQKILQLDTYGSSKREHVEKISQSFQIDKETAVFLHELIQKEFEL